MALQVADTKQTPEVCVLLSGGIDSTTCLAFYIEIGRQCSAMFIDHQHPAAQREARAAQQVADHYQVSLTKLGCVGGTLKRSGLIPGRNAFLLTSAFMERPPTVTTIAMGIHSGTSYRDCSPQFVEQMNSVFSLCSDGKVSIGTPFLHWTKAEIWSFCRTRQVPLELTWSCEDSAEIPCGKCLSCLDREAANAFA